LNNLLSLKPRDKIDIQGTLMIVGRDEDDNIIFRLSGSGKVSLDLTRLLFNTSSSSFCPKGRVRCVVTTPVCHTRGLMWQGCC
jgi:hypothetical protein